MFPGREAGTQAAAVTWAAGHVLVRTAVSRRLRAVAPPPLERARSRLRTWRRGGDERAGAFPGGARVRSEDSGDR